MCKQGTNTECLDFNVQRFNYCRWKTLVKRTVINPAKRNSVFCWVLGSKESAQIFEYVQQNVTRERLCWTKFWEFDSLLFFKRTEPCNHYYETKGVQTMDQQCVFEGQFPSVFLPLKMKGGGSILQPKKTLKHWPFITPARDNKKNEFRNTF